MRSDKTSLPLVFETGIFSKVFQHRLGPLSDEGRVAFGVTERVLPEFSGSTRHSRCMAEEVTYAAIGTGRCGR